MLARTVSRFAGPVSRLAVARSSMPAARAMSTGGLKGFNEKERAAEQIWFNKEEERVMRNLLKKIKSQAETHDTAASEVSLKSEKAALIGIVGKYKLSEADIQALMDWKHTTH